MLQREVWTLVTCQSQCIAMPQRRQVACCREEATALREYLTEVPQRQDHPNGLRVIVVGWRPERRWGLRQQSNSHVGLMRWWKHSTISYL